MACIWRSEDLWEGVSWFSSLPYESWNSGCLYPSISPALHCVLLEFYWGWNGAKLVECLSNMYEIMG